MTDPRVIVFVAKLEILRQEQLAESQADPDPTTGYDDHDRERLFRAMNRSVAGSAKVRALVAALGLSYEEVREAANEAGIEGFLNAAYPRESFNRLARDLGIEEIA
jgi:hypothetical protein